MTAEQAAQLLDHAITSVGAGGAYLYQIANGEHVVRIKKRDYWLWGFNDLTAYAHELKQERKAQRREVQRAIDTGEPWREAV